MTYAEVLAMPVKQGLELMAVAHWELEALTDCGALKQLKRFVRAGLQISKVIVVESTPWRLQEHD